MTKEKEKYVNIEVKEFDKEVDVIITPLKRDKTINIKYVNDEGHEEFMMTDAQLKGIEIQRNYSVVSTYDGDVDWGIESLYPCDNCDTKRNLINKQAERIEYLEKLIKKIAEIG